nr:septation protein IspZ [Burkholderiales bacterium]
VAMNFSEATWVKFKMFGTLGLMLVFIFVQSLLLSKYMEDKEN